MCLSLKTKIRHFIENERNGANIRVGNPLVPDYHYAHPHCKVHRYNLNDLRHYNDTDHRQKESNAQTEEDSIVLRMEWRRLSCLLLVS